MNLRKRLSPYLRSETISSLEKRDDRKLLEDFFHFVAENGLLTKERVSAAVDNVEYLGDVFFLAKFLRDINLLNLFFDLLLKKAPSLNFELETSLQAMHRHDALDNNWVSYLLNSPSPNVAVRLYEELGLGDTDAREQADKLLNDYSPSAINTSIDLIIGLDSNPLAQVKSLTKMFNNPIHVAMYGQTNCEFSVDDINRLMSFAKTNNNAGFFNLLAQKREPPQAQPLEVPPTAKETLLGYLFEHKLSAKDFTSVWQQNHRPMIAARLITEDSFCTITNYESLNCLVRDTYNSLNHDDWQELEKDIKAETCDKLQSLALY